MWKYHVCLKASTFHSSKLIKKLLEGKSTLPYNKAKIFDFLKLRMQVCIISPTAIGKMCQINCFYLLPR